MDTQKKSIQLEFKFNRAAADDYGNSFGSFVSLIVALASATVLSLFIDGVISSVLGLIIGYVLFKALEKRFKKAHSEAIGDNLRAVNEAIAPYGLFSYYDGGIGYLDRVTFYDKETDEMYRSSAGHVNGDVVSMVIEKD